MLTLQWSRKIHGTIGYMTDESVLTCPDWSRGGWWGRYRRSDGAVIWERWHYRGGWLFFILNGVIIASTFPASGIYAFDWRDGKKLWSRLGYKFNWLLKLLDLLPLTNMGDVAAIPFENGIVTNSGRLLDPATGRVIRRCDLRYDGPRFYIDGALVPANPASCKASLGTYDASRGILDDEHALKTIRDLLWKEKIVISLDHRGGHRARHVDGMFIVVACEVPDSYRDDLEQRGNASFPNTPHYLFALRNSDYEVLYREELGHFSVGLVTWSADGVVAVSLATTFQQMVGSRHLRFYAMQ